MNSRNAHPTILRFEANSEPIPGYRLLERLGSGGFGEVWKCEAPGGIHKAVKIIHGDLRNKDNDLIRYAEQELKALKRVKSVRHPYLLALDRYDIVEGRLLIVMELADSNLWDRFRECRMQGLPGIPRADLLNYMEEAAEVLDLMNFEHQLLHLDIKPQNIFLQYNHVKVGDFGQVKDLEGIMASVTGGITPVYAAPETFDGMVTRFCDQYSLACVYQELLTGQRPFDGTSMQQLLMQHLSLPPNLAPSPPSDRPALEKALAKQPEQRFTNCTEFVLALRHGLPRSLVLATQQPDESTESCFKPLTELNTANSLELARNSTEPSSTSSFVTLGSGAANTPMPEDLIEVLPQRTAPPEETGPGGIRPSLIIGLGGIGMELLQTLQRQIHDRFGSPTRLPAIRTLLIDTDPATLEQATAPSLHPHRAPLRPEEVFPARINRANYYLKPRPTGRTLIDGWFEPTLLHRLPRNPVTMGFRAVGRLALCDHYRQLIQKIELELEHCIAPEAIQATLAATGQPLGSNRPRVYLATSLAGGTGSGMVIDLAYIIRHRLRRFGYENPDVIGLFFIPPDAPEDDLPPAVRINVVAALTELNHYCHPESVYQAFFDDRHAFLRDAGPPLTRLMLWPFTPASPITSPAPRNTRGGSGAVGSAPRPLNSQRSSSISSTASIRGNRTQRSQSLRALAQDSAPPLPPADDHLVAAAHFLRLELLSGINQTLHPVRTQANTNPTSNPGSNPASAILPGLYRFDWPRAAIVASTARIVSTVVLDQWVLPNQNRAREVIPTWTASLWQRLGLNQEQVSEKLRQAANAAFHNPVDQVVQQMGTALISTGWIPRAPDAARTAHVLVQWEQILGHPSTDANRPPTTIEQAMREAANQLASTAQVDIASTVPRLIDDPNFRLAGAEEVSRQLLADVQRQLAAINAETDSLQAQANFYYGILNSHAHRIARQPSAEIHRALEAYPRLRLQLLQTRSIAQIYSSLLEPLTNLKNDVASCRQRLLAFKESLSADNHRPDPPLAPNQVLPPGCPSITSAAQKYLSVLTDDDLHQLEAWVQAGIEQNYGGLFEACLNTTDGASGLLAVLRDQTHAYLNARLGMVNLAAMFHATFGSAEAVYDRVRAAFHQAAPSLIAPGPWSQQAVAVVFAPEGESGELLREAASHAAADAGPLHFIPAADEVILYREYPAVPLAALPQCGPAWVAAYSAASEILQASPHARIDVPQWISIDAG